MIYFWNLNSFLRIVEFNLFFWISYFYNTKLITNKILAMKIKSLLLLALLGISITSVFSQEYRIHVKAQDGNWKYINLKEEIIHDVNYSLSYQYSESGIALGYYAINDRYVFIDKDGKQIETELKHFQLESKNRWGAVGFTDSVVVIKTKRLWGTLGADGKIVHQLKFDKISDFDGGYGIGVIGPKFYILSNKGGEMLVDNPGVRSVREFSEGLAPFVATDGKLGFLDKDGKIVIPAIYKGVGFFRGGLAWARDLSGLIGYINTKGEWVISPKFNMAKHFDASSGMARVSIGKKMCYTTTTGDIRVFTVSEVYDDYSEGLAKGRKMGFWGFFDTKGEWVISPQFEGVRDFRNGFAAAKYKGYWGIINTKGEWVIQPKYLGIHDVIIIK